MRRILLAIIGVLATLADPPRQDMSADDAAIYKAVIDHTIRPAAVRAAKAVGIVDFPSLLVIDRTVALCRADRPVPPRIGCLRGEDIQSFEQGSRYGTRMFDPPISQSVRQRLANSFRMRNTESHPVPDLNIDDILFVDAAKLDESIKRDHRQWRSYSVFSRPAYSSEDQALIYAAHNTSQGQGWYFVLERRAGEWRVQSVRIIWIG